MDLQSRIDALKEQISRAPRNEAGSLIVSELDEKLKRDLEGMLECREIRRAELSSRLGLTLLQLTSAEEELFRISLQEEADRVAREGAKSETTPEIIESFHFQAVKVVSGEAALSPKEAMFPDSKVWIRILSVNGLKIELNSITSAVEILKTILDAHRKPSP